ncbi:hypothetical protein [Planococcus donghaensis]|uniref:hypothetical protein n=1 Tax=Planococcus donghaensis TaxID=414778 RepID=UPI003736C539
MSRIQNQKGYALLLVMLMVVLFTLMGMGLLAMNMNAAKQFNTKEEQIQARNQAEMGVLHYKASAEKLIEERNKKIVALDKKAINIKSQEELINLDFCESLMKPLARDSDIDDGSYIVSFIQFEGEDCLTGSNMMEIKINSTGTMGKINSQSKSGSEKKIEAEIKMQKFTGATDGNSNPDSNPDSNLEDFVVINEDTLIPNGAYTPPGKSLYFKKDLNVAPGNSGGGTDVVIAKDLKVDLKMNLKNHGCFIVRNDLIVEGELYIGSKMSLFIYGDAYLPRSIILQNKNAKLYVNGDVYIGGSKTPVSPKPYPSFSGTVIEVDEVEDDEDNHKKPEKDKNKVKYSCTLPGPYVVNAIIPAWSIVDEIKAEYK